MSTRHANGTSRSSLAGSACLALAVTACGGHPMAVPPEAASPAPAVDVVRVVAHPLDVTLEMPGELDPYEAVAIFPKVTAFVKTMRVDRGSAVRAGELLVELDAPELVAERGEAQSKLQGAQADLGRRAVESRRRSQHVRKAAGGLGHSRRRGGKRPRAGGEDRRRG